MTVRASSENVTSRFCDHFSLSHHACKMYYNSPGIKLVSALWKKTENFFIMWSRHPTVKRVISRRGKDENGSQMYKNENYTCKARKTTVFHC